MATTGAYEQLIGMVAMRGEQIVPSPRTPDQGHEHINQEGQRQRRRKPDIAVLGGIDAKAGKHGPAR